RDGGHVFAENEPKLTGAGPRELFGKAEALTVRFPGSRLPIDGDLVRTTMERDVALIRIASPQALQALELSETPPRLGDRTTLLYYRPPAPGVLRPYPKNGRTAVPTETLREPVVLEAIVMDPGPRSHLGDIAPDVFRISSNEARSGPVFNTDGKVVGL